MFQIFQRLERSLDDVAVTSLLTADITTVFISTMRALGTVADRLAQRYHKIKSPSALCSFIINCHTMFLFV